MLRNIILEPNGFHVPLTNREYPYYADGATIYIPNEHENKWGGARGCCHAFCSGSRAANEEAGVQHDDASAYPYRPGGFGYTCRATKDTGRAS
ncbi:hypothetical protein [Parapedobacter tibetensis]|uniref:hypothetical protein n=1 Tax=Parapedobacter tibetensis TaxID=2972951 RepID=UPI00214DD3AF|nr:hypothetical protein [Parapedobacter tibetensis]